ncbi:DUF5655 domain-containing protein [Cellulomonas soli]|uniref:DUF5655 domain-containing protein n=1 Tax=Cellulomonas soli TaxID=931535 RepID=UPI003F8752E0
MDDPGPPTPEAVFSGDPRRLELYRAVEATLLGLGAVTVRASASQVAFRRRRTFAIAWWPGRYVQSDVPVVLSIASSTPLTSVRFKEVVHPSPNVWLHHLELQDAAQLDHEVHGWLQAAYDAAG